MTETPFGISFKRSASLLLENVISMSIVYCLHFCYNAADERASFCVLDPFVIAPLFSLFCATNTGIVSCNYALFVLSAALSQTQLFLLMSFNFIEVRIMKSNNNSWRNILFRFWLNLMLLIENYHLRLIKLFLQLKIK